ncbi:FGGY-family carbohydrate kinase [Ceratobasidium sp. AG-Ba]|nr:FGGY-family carbohydrate kinase [Ceratobasidium sp. AG-Ba]
MAHYLGLELATENIRACVVDEALDVVHTCMVEFDTDLPEFQTRGGLFTAPGDVYTTSVEMWLKALDILLAKLKTGIDLSRVRAVGGCAQHAAVWCTSAAQSHLAELDPAKSLHSQLGTPSTLALVHTPVVQDTSTSAQARSIKAALGGPDALAQRVGTACPTTAAQAIKIREGNPDAWTHTARVVLASAFLATVLTGKWAPAAEAEAVATGLWNIEKGAWDEQVLELVAAGKEEGERLKSMLGDVCSAGTTTVGSVGPYFVQKYGFAQDTPVAPFTSDHLGTYLSLSACLAPPSASQTPDSILSFGSSDILLAPVPSSIPTPPRSRHYTLLPHPCTPKSYISVLASRNGDVPRALVRDMYTKSWAAFDRLVSVVPPGGAIGLDDKLFSFWMLQPEAPPFDHVKGVFRFETGVKVNEFRDLRANPRCLLESQLLSLRVRHARMMALLSSNSSPPNRPLSLLATSLAHTFDPYSTQALPPRILALGAAAGFASVVSITADVFGSRVLVPKSVVVRGAPVTPVMTPTRAPLGFGVGGYMGAGTGGGSGTSTPGLTVPGQPPAGQQQAPIESRAALGAAYLARWAVSGSGVDFEEDVKSILKRRAKLAGGLGLGGMGTASSAMFPLATSGGYGRSGLGNSVLVEEDEEEEDDGRDRNPSGSTAATSMSLHLQIPPGTGPAGNGQNGQGSASVHALPTEESDALLGLAKVAEADMDAFAAYAALVPEWCRLENMLLKGVV